MITIPLTQTTPLYADRDGVLRLACSLILPELVVYDFSSRAQPPSV